MTATTKPRPATGAPVIADPYAHAFNLEAERAVLSPVLDGRHGDAWGLVREQGLAWTMLWHRDHRLVAMVIDRLWSDGKPIDAQAVADAAHRIRYSDAINQLREADGEKPGRVEMDPSLAFDDSLLAGLGGHNAIADLAGNYAPASALARNAALLVEYHQHRQVIGLLIDLGRRSQAVGGVGQTPKLIDEAVDRLAGVVGRGRVSQTLADAAGEVLTDHDRAHDTGIGRVRGAWGIDALDLRLPLKAGRMITVAGDPGGGKTSLALGAIMATARKLGRGSVALIPLEQDGRELVSILIARQLGVPKANLEQGWLTAEQRQAADEIRAEMARLDVYVRDCSGSSTIGDITGWVMQRQRRSGGALHLVVVDHIGLIDASNQRENEYATVSAAAKALKRLALRGLCVLNVAQMNREGRKASRDREGLVQAKPEPRLEDLRGSGSLEQDSDAVMFLWCRSDTKAPTRDVDLLSPKNRDGGAFLLNATFHAADGQRFTLRRAIADPADRADHRAAAAERVEKTAREPGDHEDLFADRNA